MKHLVALLLVAFVGCYAPPAVAGGAKEECPKGSELSEEECKLVKAWVDQIIVSTSDLCKLWKGGKFPNNVDEWADFLAVQYCKNKVEPPRIKFGCKAVARAMIKTKLNKMGAELNRLKCDTKKKPQSVDAPKP